MPWWLDDEHSKLGFPRGYHIEVWGGRPACRDGPRLLRRCASRLRRRPARRICAGRFGTTIGLTGRGEMIPNDDCYCELDPVAKDKWGIPVLRFHWKWGEPRLAQAEHMRTTLLELIDRLGGKPLDPSDAEGPAKISAKGGEMIHELGTARMGSERQGLRGQQLRPRLGRARPLLMDGSIMPSNPDKNPTLQHHGAGLARQRGAGPPVEAGPAVSEALQGRSARHAAMDVRRHGGIRSAGQRGLCGAGRAAPRWPQDAPAPVSPPGYGTDPTLLEPMVPWPRR